MLGLIRPHLSYANVMATGAMFVALGGTGYATTQLPGSAARHKPHKGHNHPAAKCASLCPATLQSLVTRVDSEIMRVGPTLKVAHAGSADTATSAGSVTNALNATNALSAANALNAANATNSSKLGGVDASSYITDAAPLLSGHKETGVWSTATGGSPALATTPILFRPRLAAAIPSTNIHFMTPGTTSSNCPGVDQAAAGHLCIYAAEVFGQDFDTFTGDPSGSNQADPQGGALYMTATGSLNASDGTWTVTAP